VLYLAGEDDDSELHRRGLTIARHYVALARSRCIEFDADAVADRLHVVSRVAANNLLTASTADGEVRRTPLVERLVDAASRIPDLCAIVLDPASRFRGGRANHEEDATRFVEALEAVREGTGAAVLATSHVSQAGIREGGGQEIVRGSTALVDGVRWVATLQRLRRDRAGDYGVAEEDADLYLRLEIPKSNYAPPFPGQWLRREAGGVLVPCELQDRREARRDRAAEATYLDVLGRIQQLIRDVGPLKRRQLRGYAGKSGVLGVGDHAVRGIVERALRDGSLFERSGGELHAPALGDE
jgi:RecA-family ATPase